MTKSSAKSAMPEPGCELKTAALESLKSAARRHPKIAGSLEVAREGAVIAVEAVRQVATGIKAGVQEIAARNAATPAPTKTRRRRAPGRSKVG